MIKKCLSTIYGGKMSLYIKWCSTDCLPVLAFLGASLQLILANKNTFNYYMYLAKMDFQFRLDASGVSDGAAIFLSDFIRFFGWSRFFLSCFIYNFLNFYKISRFYILTSNLVTVISSLVLINDCS